MNVVPIVEGDGEVKALPALLRRFEAWRPSGRFVNVLRPIRVRRDRFLNNDDEFRRQLLLAALKCEQTGWILILLDADDDCPKMLAQSILRRARAVVPNKPISVVLANREYEAWFIAAAESLRGKNGFVPKGALPDAESIRGAKEWMGKQLPPGRKYSEVIDQEAFSAVMDLQQAYDNSRSFRKLVSDWSSQLAHAGP